MLLVLGALLAVFGLLQLLGVLVLSGTAWGVIALIAGLVIVLLTRAVAAAWPRRT